VTSSLLGKYGPNYCWPLATGEVPTSVTLKLAGTSTVATLGTSATGGSGANPVTTGITDGSAGLTTVGNLSFFAALLDSSGNAQEYDAYYTLSGGGTGVVRGLRPQIDPAYIPKSVSDFLTGSPTTGDVPVWNGTAWVPGTGVGVGGGTPAFDAPTGVTATQSGTTATLYFSAPTSTGGAPLASIILHRNGADSNGTGEYTNSTVAPTAPSYDFNFLIPGDSYNLSVTYVNTLGAQSPTVTYAITMATSGGSGGGGGSGSPILLAPSGLTVPSRVIHDTNWAALGTLNASGSNVWAPSWFDNSAAQNGTMMLSSNVTVDSAGLHLLLDGSSKGALVSSNPDDFVSGHTGFQCQPTTGKPVFVQFTVSQLPNNGSLITNWPALWLDSQTWPANGELDVFEGFGDAQWHAINSGGNPGGTGALVGPLSSPHSFGALWSTTGVDIVYDGQFVAHSNQVMSGPMYLVLENSLPNGGPLSIPSTIIVPRVTVWQDA
jgi:hypothetical protein